MKKKKLLVFTVLIAVLFIFVSSCKTDVKEEVIMKKDDDKASIAIMVAEGFQDAEAYMPMGFLYNKGYTLTVIGIETGKVKAYNSDYTIKIQKAISEVSVDDFDALILPGGKGPAVLRENEKAVDFAGNFFESGKTIAAICHGPQVLITAGVLKDITCTGYSGIKEELQNAGANFVDKEVVTDKNLITSRTPPDLYAFSKTIADSLKKQLSDKKEK